MPNRVFYISESRVDHCGPQLRDILEVGSARNAQLGVTGLLCCSGAHFAQILEGGGDSLDALMASIRRDERHAIVTEWPAAAAADARWFRGWSLAYVFDDRLEQLLGRLSNRRESLHDVTRELMRDVDFFQSTRR